MKGNQCSFQPAGALCQKASHDTKGVTSPPKPKPRAEPETEPNPSRSRTRAETETEPRPNQIKLPRRSITKNRRGPVASKARARAVA